MKIKSDMALINRTIAAYRPKLFLQGWTITVIHSETNQENSDRSTVAWVEVLHEYMSATITIFPAFYKQSKALQVQTLVHELCHCHTQAALNAISRFQSGGFIHQDHTTEIMEKLTQTICMIAIGKAA